MHKVDSNWHQISTNILSGFLKCRERLFLIIHFLNHSIYWLDLKIWICTSQFNFHIVLNTLKGPKCLNVKFWRYVRIIYIERYLVHCKTRNNLFTCESGTNIAYVNVLSKFFMCSLMTWTRLIHKLTTWWVFRDELDTWDFSYITLFRCAYVSYLRYYLQMWHCFYVSTIVKHFFQ